MNTEPAYLWYKELIKPTWAPPSWIFGPVWSFLYILIFVSFGKVFQMALTKQIPYIVALPFLLNIVSNIVFTPLQFWLRNNLLAMIDIFVVLLTLIWAMYAIFPYAKWVTYIQIPYLLWVSFATVLQVSVFLLNR